MINYRWTIWNYFMTMWHAKQEILQASKSKCPNGGIPKRWNGWTRRHWLIVMTMAHISITLPMHSLTVAINAATLFSEHHMTLDEDQVCIWFFCIEFICLLNTFALGFVFLLDDFSTEIIRRKQGVVHQIERVDRNGLQY